MYLRGPKGGGVSARDIRGGGGRLFLLSISLPTYLLLFLSQITFTYKYLLTFQLFRPIIMAGFRRYLLIVMATMLRSDAATLP